MSKYYLMAQKVPDNGTVIQKVSHKRTRQKTGHFLPNDFEGPYICILLGQFANGVMSTFYMSPAIIGTKQFYQDLLDCGIDNIEVKPVVINDPVNEKTIDNYVLLNIIGRISCADMEKSEYGTIGKDMHVMNKLVINLEKAYNFDLFLADEDTDCIVISERVYKYLTKKGYTDIYFEELEHV
ncbi:hypothetical protein MNBD_GAMMA17-1956 [hydrothermal vent metagenome]|uniref:Immunity MXAN-0049 protein domain-containing protein n=1 Tax=hydrothermal vent metagenome TaxID=652676 RepID=A0A3B0ZNN6_9ZZZZ